MIAVSTYEATLIVQCRHSIIIVMAIKRGLSDYQQGELLYIYEDALCKWLKFKLKLSLCECLFVVRPSLCLPIDLCAFP